MSTQSDADAVRKLVEAARAAICQNGIPNSSMGALSEALKPFAPQYVQALERQSAKDAGDAPVVRVPRP